MEECLAYCKLSTTIFEILCCYCGLKVRFVLNETRLFHLSFSLSGRGVVCACCRKSILSEETLVSLLWIPSLRVFLPPFGPFLCQSGEPIREPRMIILSDAVQPLGVGTSVSPHDVWLSLCVFKQGYPKPRLASWPSLGKVCPEDFFGRRSIFRFVLN